MMQERPRSRKGKQRKEESECQGSVLWEDPGEMGLSGWVGQRLLCVVLV